MLGKWIWPSNVTVYGVATVNLSVFRWSRAAREPAYNKHTHDWLWHENHLGIVGYCMLSVSHAISLAAVNLAGCSLACC